MRVLALDTTTRAGSVALVSRDRVDDVVLLASDRPQATQLPGAALDLLSRARLRLVDIDVFAVAVGPGSFSGIRIGIATIQGFSLVVDRPVVPVPALDALAAWRDGGLVPSVTIGDGALRYRDELPADAIILGHPALAAAVGRIAVAAVERGDVTDAARIRPLYVRRPDVEIARDAGHMRTR
jgi:tRNA A37 threonylcarbamoyladenosine modification protein TsaB